MEETLIRIAAVINKTGKSRSSIYADIANGIFPKPVKIGPRSVAWPSSLITTWIKEKINPAPLKKKSGYNSQGVFELAAEDI